MIVKQSIQVVALQMQQYTIPHYRPRERIFNRLRIHPPIDWEKTRPHPSLLSVLQVASFPWDRPLRSSSVSR